MSFSLTMLNLWIGLCRGASGLPKDLRELDYVDKGIDFTFANRDLEKVCPDLIVESAQTAHTLLLEFKSGANTEPDQLRRYSRVTKNDLTKKAFVSRRAAQSHDVTVVGRSAHGNRLQKGISDGGYPFPLLVADDRGLRLQHNHFSSPSLSQVFSPTLEINWDRIPTAFVPLDAESELWEVAEVVVPKLLGYLTERRPLVRVEELCQAICNTWSIMGRPARDTIKQKVRDVLREAARRHFKPYLRWKSERGGCIEIVDNPLELEPDKRTSAFRRLRTAQAQFIERLRRGPLPDAGDQRAFGFYEES